MSAGLTYTPGLGGRLAVRRPLSATISGAAIAGIATRAAVRASAETLQSFFICAFLPKESGATMAQEPCISFSLLGEWLRYKPKRETAMRGRPSYTRAVMMFWKPRRRSEPPLPPENLLAGVGPGEYWRIGRETVSLVDELVTVRPEDRILDVGCGLGRVAWPLAG